MATISGIAFVFIFISGAVLLIYSAEKLVGYLVESAGGLGISAFVLAIVFTGIEFDDLALGVALGLEDLGGVALGVVFGTALALSGVALALACVLAPSRVHIPKDYLTLLAVSPLVVLPFVFLLAGGALTTIESIVLIGLFVLFVGYVAYRERRRARPVIRNQEVLELVGGGDRAPFARRGWVGVAELGLAVVALAGLVVGAATTGIGAEGIVTTFGLAGTVFGATIITAVLSIEDVVLTVAPIRKGAPEIGIGNVIGSVVFSVTGKLGVIGLAGSIVIKGHALTWHFGALLTLTLLAAVFIAAGRLRPRYGYALLALYVAYWVGSYAFLDVVPAEL